MKVTKEQLLRIIKEEMTSINTTSELQDVEKMIQYIDKIDTKQEYNKLLQTVLFMDIDGKREALIALLDASTAEMVLNAIEKAKGR